jgi:hypothetical protein
MDLIRFDLIRRTIDSLFPYNAANNTILYYTIDRSNERFHCKRKCTVDMHHFNKPAVVVIGL